MPEAGDGKMDECSQQVQTFSYISHGVVYSMVPRVNNTIVYSKIAKSRSSRVSTRKKFSQYMLIDLL